MRDIIGGLNAKAKKIVQIFILLAIIFIVLLALLLILNKDFLTGMTIAQQDDTIKIGAMLLLSGEGASWGQASQRAIDMAVEQANDNGGVNGKNIKVIYEDTHGKSSDAISAYNKLKDIDKVIAIIGPNMETEMSAIAPLAARDNLPVIAPSYAPIENRPNPKNPLMIWLDPTIESQTMAGYVYMQNITSISILGTQDSWEKEVSLAFSKKFIDLGGNVLFFELIQYDDDSVKTAVAKSIEKNPHAVYLGTYYQFLNYGKALKELGYQGKIYSIEVDEYLADQGKDFDNDLEFISPDLYIEDFRDRYVEKYGEPSNIPAGQSYDATNILISFLRNDSSREGILSQMMDFQGYEGVSGMIRIIGNTTVMPLSIYRIQDGKIIKIKEIT